MKKKMSRLKITTEERSLSKYWSKRTGEGFFHRKHDLFYGIDYSLDENFTRYDGVLSISTEGLVFGAEATTFFHRRFDYYTLTISGLIG